MKKISTFIIRSYVYRALGRFDRALGNKSRVFVLCYHGIDSSDWRFSISRVMFKEQVNYLKKEGYTFVTTDDIIDHSKGIKKLPHYSVAITFDDGYKSMMQIAPFLKAQHIKPTLFLLSNTKAPDWKEIGKKDTFLSKSDINQLVKNGWIIGSHSSTHANLTLLSESKLFDEIVNAKKLLETTLGASVLDFAYPRGRYNDLVLKYVKRAGFKTGWTMDDDIISNKTDMLRIPRIGVDRSHTFSEFKTLFSPSAIVLRKIIKSTPFGGLL